MGSPPPPSPSPAEAEATSTLNQTFTDPNQKIEHHTKINFSSNTAIIKKKLKPKRRKNIQIDVSSNLPQQSSSSSSCSTSNLSHSRSKGILLSGNRRNPRIFTRPFSQKQSDSEADALALPLGMSIAAFVAQVLERKDAAGEKMSVDHLSRMCTLAVKESLTNVFGDKFGCFVNNFERSFQSTLTTLRVINESENNVKQTRLKNKNKAKSNSPLTFGGGECSISDSHNETMENASSGVVNRENVYHDPISRELTFHESQNSRQLTFVSPNTMLSTFEKSVTEQARSNDLKAYEINLLMKKMKLKEAQIAVDCDSNVLERLKLSMGISKAKFRAEKFKTELEDSRHGELLKTCADCLVAGLLIMLAGLAYGTYVHSHERLLEATESCMPIKESSSWWMPKQMASFNSGFQILRCQVQVISRMLFGVLMIVAITYLLIQRSGSTNQTMPVTFILLLLGVGCGFAGKFCIDTLGGDGNCWLFYWEILCLLHFLSNVFTSILFNILNGSVQKMSTKSKLFPYWMRKFVFYATVLVFLPLMCGLMPFADLGEWREHFISLFATRLEFD